MTDAMGVFAEIEAAATALSGSAEALEARLVRPEPPESLAMIGNDRYLSVMCRRIFRAGLTHRLVDARWPAFEIAFDEFEPARVAAFTDDELKRLATDETLIRHRKKLNAVRDNAIVMQTLIDEFGTFGVWLADWDVDETIDLWLELKSNRKVYGLWKSGQATYDDYRYVVKLCREKIRKTKAQLELNLITKVKDNKK